MSLDEPFNEFNHSNRTNNSTNLMLPTAQQQQPQLHHYFSRNGSNTDQLYVQNSLNTSSLEYQEVNYSQQKKNQRLLNTLENQDHLIIQALYQKDLRLNISHTGNNNIANGASNGGNTFMNMKVIGPSYDKGHSIARAKHNILKSMVDKT